MPGLVGRQLRFGVFEVDLDRAELHKHGLRVRLQEQPFQVLAALLERPGEVVGREELIRRLWPDGTMVDFDRGLNAAVTRLRQALSDSAEVPRYVETVARRGYRFIAAVENAREFPAVTPAATPPRLVQDRSKRWSAAASVILVGGMFLWWALYRNQRHEFGASLKAAPLTAATGVEMNPSFSPDGTQIVYEWNRDGRRHIYLKVVGPGDPVALTSGEGSEYGPVWSPDGTSIAFIGHRQNSWGLWLTAPLGGTPRKVADVAGIAWATRVRAYRHLDWTRDSHHIIASVFGQAGWGWESLLLVSIDTGQKTWLTSPTEVAMSGDREPAVSPDGTKVAFARGAIDSERLFIMPLTANLRPSGPPSPLDAAGLARGPAWMANGRELIFITLDPEMITGSGLSWIDLAAGKQRHLAALGAMVATPAVSQRGIVAYSTIGQECTLWQQEIPTPGEPTAPPVKVTSASTTILGAEYSPDGSRVAFASERSGTREIWNCARDGSHCLQVTPMVRRRFADMPRWSPDGSQIAFGALAGNIWDAYVVDANGGAPRELTTHGPHGTSPYWSHDGKWIYYFSVDSGKPVIWKMAPLGGEAKQVTRGRVVIDSPDSKSLFYSDGGAKKLFRSDADGGGETELLNDMFLGSFAVAADRIYYIHDDSEGVNEIRRLLLSNGENSRVVRLDKPLTQGLSLSPDGRSLLFTEGRRRGNLMIAGI
jgi:Tol biopolymer transport system component/DNA-binding winged helix-turn-helix (wHTH) protein